MLENLPKVLRPTSEFFVYDPSRGVTRTRQRQEQKEEEAIKQFLAKHEKTTGGQLKPGDLVYVKWENEVEGQHGPERPYSGYHSAHYLHVVVESDGRKWFKTVVDTPAHPPASRSWLNAGTLIPIGEHEECYRVRKQPATLV